MGALACRSFDSPVIFPLQVSANGRVATRAATILSYPSVGSGRERLTAGGTCKGAARHATLRCTGERLKLHPAPLANHPLQTIWHSGSVDQVGTVLPEFSLSFSMAPPAESYQVSQPIGYQVRTEQNKRSLVVNEQVGCRSTMTALVSVTLSGGFALPTPVRPTVVAMTSAPCRIRLAGHVPAHKFDPTLCIAEVPLTDCGLVPIYRRPALMASKGQSIANLAAKIAALPFRVTIHPTERAALLRPVLLVRLPKKLALALNTHKAHLCRLAAREALTRTKTGRPVRTPIESLERFTALLAHKALRGHSAHVLMLEKRPTLSLRAARASASVL
jgi:hypothetical protein